VFIDVVVVVCVVDVFVNTWLETELNRAGGIVATAGPVELSDEDEPSLAEEALSPPPQAHRKEAITNKVPLITIFIR